MSVDLSDFIHEPIISIVTGGDEGSFIIYTPVYELIIEPSIDPDGVQCSLEYTINKYAGERDDA